MCSMIESLSSFDRYDCFKMFQMACKDALPIVPALIAILELGLISHPQLFRNDDLENPEGEDFILDASKERTEKAIDLYLDRRVEVTAPTEELKVSALANLKSALVDACHRRMAQIDRIATDFGIKKVSFGISIPSDVGPAQEAPFEAVGTRTSFFSNPMIVASPPQLKIQVDPSIAVASDLSEQQKAGEKAKEFIVAHEMVHIAKNHELIASISNVAFSVLTTGIWIAGLGSKITLASAVCTYGFVLGAAIPFELFFYSLRRAQEKEADLEAVRYLKTNEGAVASFEAFAKRGVVQDLEHPSLDQRIAYIGASA